MPVLLPFAELLARAYVRMHGTLSPPLAAAGYTMLEPVRYAGPACPARTALPRLAVLVDDRDGKVVQTDEIFQSVPLPAGTARTVSR